MASKARGNRRYQYVSIREGSRTRSLYFGSGPEAEQRADKFLKSRRAKRLAEKQRQQRHEDEENAVAASVIEYGKQTDLFVRAHLLVAGFWQHDRGEWRKKRDGSRKPQGK